MTHISDSELALYAGEDLGVVEAARVARHVDECEQCRKKVKEIRTAAEWLKSLAAEPSRDEVLRLQSGIALRVEESQKRQSLLWPKTAAAVAAALILIVFVRLAPRLRVNTEQPKRSDFGHEKTIARGVKRDIQLRVGVQPAAPAFSTKVRHTRKRRPAAAGIESMSVIAQNEGPPVIKLKTTDPNVVILWVMNKTERESGHE
jgi:anti-sigma factor RsiW